MNALAEKDPAKALHWDGSNSDEEVIVQVFGIGPGGHYARGSEAAVLG